jgi:hypothetical protein
VASQSAFFVFSKQSSSYTHPPPKNKQWVCPLEALLLETWKRCYNNFKLICALSLKKNCVQWVLINLHHKIIIFFILKWRKYCSFKVTMIYTFILKKKMRITNFINLHHENCSSSLIYFEINRIIIL